MQLSPPQQLLNLYLPFGRHTIPHRIQLALKNKGNEQSLNIYIGLDKSKFSA